MQRTHASASKVRMLRQAKYACFGKQSTHASACKERMLGKSFAFAAIKGTLGSKEHWASTEQMLRHAKNACFGMQSTHA